MIIRELIIHCSSGKGGNGVIHFRRNKFISKGGPDGGNGGDGGSVFFVANNFVSNLNHLKKKRFIKADNGFDGSINFKKGKKGEDLFIQVPINTTIIDMCNNIIFKLNRNKDSILVFKGGRGGLGNSCFKTSFNRSPNICTQGLKGKSGNLYIELNLISDVAIIGLPNAGKSTLLSVMTSAKPLIGNYPFTTIDINLGLLYNKLKNKSLIISDYPGIIKGSSKGKGLGFRFLKNLYYSTIFLFVISIESIDPAVDFEILLNELFLFDSILKNKKRILIFTKIDLLNQKQKLEFEKKVPKNEDVIFVSSFNNIGINYMTQRIFDLFKKN